MGWKEASSTLWNNMLARKVADPTHHGPIEQWVGEKRAGASRWQGWSAGREGNSMESFGGGVCKSSGQWGGSYRA